MTAITVEEIQRDFGSYLRQVRKGVRLLILDADRPVAELRPIAEPRPADDSEKLTLEPEIQQVYSELRDLVARSAEDTSLGPENRWGARPAPRAPIARGGAHGEESRVASALRPR